MTMEKIALRVSVGIIGDGDKIILAKARKIHAFFQDSTLCDVFPTRCLSGIKTPVMQIFSGRATLEQIRTLLTLSPCLYFPYHYSNEVPAICGEATFRKSLAEPASSLFRSLTISLSREHPYHLWEPFLQTYLEDCIVERTARD
jgi:hypothetical protein